VPVETAAAEPPRAEAPPGHPPIEAAPAPVNPVRDPHEVAVRTIEGSFAGTIRLKGSLATREDGFVFVSVRPGPTGMYCYMRRYALSDPAHQDDETGERVIAFELNKSHTLSGLIDAELFLEAYFDSDGDVLTMESEPILRQVRVEPNDMEIELVLDPEQG
jgi:hypothetical protein